MKQANAHGPRATPCTRYIELENLTTAKQILSISYFRSVSPCLDILPEPAISFSGHSFPMAFPCTLVAFSTLLAVFNCLRFGQMIYIAVLAGILFPPPRPPMPNITGNPTVIVSLLVASGVASLVNFCVKMAGVVRGSPCIIWAFVGSSFLSIFLEFLTFAALLVHMGAEFGKGLARTRRGHFQGSPSTWTSSWPRCCSSPRTPSSRPTSSASATSPGGRRSSDRRPERL